MYTSALHTSVLAIVIFLMSSSMLDGQITSVDPLKSFDRGSDADRSFKKMKEDVLRTYKDTPVKGNHKRALRSLHYWESRLDGDGNMLNNVRANMEALQLLYIDTFPGLIQGDWQHIGPLTTVGTEFNQEGVGRVNQIYFASATTWYAGTAGGGLWRTDVAGIYPGAGPYPWYPLTDSLPVLSISGISVHPTNVDDVYILTGDGESITYTTRGTQPGIGILHSTDGGVTWDTTALTYTVTQQEAGYKLLRYPGSIDTMFAACTDGLWRTTDGWVNSALQINSDTCFDIEFKPDDPQTVYAAFDGNLRRSTDGGSFFQTINANLVQTNIVPNSVMGRMAIGVSEDNPNILYVLISKESDGGLASFQVSLDAGDNFVELANNNYNLLAAGDPETDTDGQGNYDLALWVDPSNSNTVIVGGVNLYKSTSGGLLWTQLVHWTNDPPEYTHADVHAIEKSPGGQIIVGTDGGLYASSNGGFDWENRSHGLGISQFYHLDVYTGFLGIPFVTGGAQDNGTSTGLGLADPTFEMIGGGDGFRAYRGTLDGTPTRYRSSQNGKLYAQQQLGIWGETLITPDDELDGNNEGLGLWDTPYQPSPNNFEELIAGYDNLYYSGSAGENWSSLSYPSGYTYDGTGLIKQLARSKSNTNIVYLYVSDTTQRHLYRSALFYAAAITGTLENGNCHVDDLNAVDTMPSGDITDIALSDYNNNEVWVSFPGYSDSMKVYYNQDMVSDSPWVNISYNLPNVPVHCVEWSIDGLFAGTDIGAFFLHHGDSVWIYYSQGLPTVAVTEIEIRNTVSGTLVFASTWGRGIWWSTPPPPLRRTRWYVDSSAVGANTGADWANAFPELQIALDTILPGDSIWVAAGTYYPEGLSGFHLQYDNVRIWGGFIGTEDSVSQRNFVANPTILSGDIGAPGDSLDNANHVFVFGGTNGNVLLDGFHVTDGFAKEAGEKSNGGGIYYSTGTQTGKPLIANCRIYHNTALGGGGNFNHVGYGAGMYIADYATGDPDMYITHCTFENNYSLNRGGGLGIDVAKTSIPRDTGTAVVYLDSCTFIYNVAGSEGGGIYLEAINKGNIMLFIDSTVFEGNGLVSFTGNGGGIAGDAQPGSGTIEMECTNTLFAGHSIGNNADGGAVHLDGSGGTVESTYIACVFDDNDAQQGGAIYSYSPNGNSFATLNFVDCAFTNNSTSGIASGGAIYINSRLRGNSTSTFSNTTFTDNSTPGSGNVLLNGEYGGQMISTMNSCTFSNNASGNGGAVYVYGRNDNGGPGNIDLTINDCLFNDNTSTASGGALHFFSNLSIIHANIIDTDFENNSAGGDGGAVYHTHIANDTSNITVSYANCNFTSNTTSNTTTNDGGALYLDKTDVTLDQCTFTENVSYNGGAIFNYDVSFNESYTQSFNSCAFLRNRATNFGGAMYNRHDSPSLMLIDVVDCVFDSNYTTSISSSSGKGGAIFDTGIGRSIQNISNTLFEDNLATFDGGAIYVAGVGTNPVDTLFMNVDSCTFINNHAGASPETVELYGYAMRIISQWANTNFYNDLVGVIFRNRKHTSGFSRATFIDTYIH